MTRATRPAIVIRRFFSDFKQNQKIVQFSSTILNFDIFSDKKFNFLHIDQEFFVTTLEKT